MTMAFVIRWRRAFGVLASTTALALYQPAAASQQPGGPAGRIAIASKAPGVLTVVGLQGQPAREFKVGYRRAFTTSIWIGHAPSMVSRFTGP